MNNTSAPEWLPQFREGDGSAFFEIIYEPDAERRLAAYSTRADMLLGEILRYGALNDGAMIPWLQAVYARTLEDGMSTDLRSEIYRHVVGFQQAGKSFSPNAYLPFIACDPDRGICSTAVIDYTSLAPIDPGDAMSRVRDIVGMIENRFPANVGAAFGGVLCLGDPRVCRLLLPLRDALTDVEANEAILCRTGFLSAAATEFLLDWLEGMDGDGRDRLFGIVASGLALSRRDMRAPLVATGERTFPVGSLNADAERERLGLISIDAYTARIAPRLRALERTEPEPKVMPDVLAFWDVAADALPPRRTRGAAVRFEQSNEAWIAAPGRILATWSIFNPNGPTLNCAGTGGRGRKPGLWYRWMHFMGGDSWNLGAGDGGADFGAALLKSAGTDAPSPYALQPVTCIPSFVTFEPEARDALRRLLLGSPAVRGADWGREIHLLRRWRDDLFGRAGEELREAMEMIRADPSPDPDGRRADFVRMTEIRYAKVRSFTAWDGIRYESAPFHERLFEEWWMTVSDARFVAQALAQFAQAWVGATAMVPGITVSQGREPTSFEELKQFLEAGGHALYPGVISTPRIAKGLGL